ncbi:MAG: DUF3798 domain-containing protein [Candidatus Eiseniibacteriota bacterium]
MFRSRAALAALIGALLSAGCSSDRARAPAAESHGPLADSSAQAHTSAAGPPFHIGIMCGTVSQGEEDYRACQQVAARYPGHVKLVSYPDNFSTELETVISQMVSLAEDPSVKVIIDAEAIPGSVAAARRIRELRPDILIGLVNPHEDPDVVSSVCDLAAQTDEETRGVTIIESAQKMGAKHFVHYSFPRHMAMLLLARRRDVMITECARRGIQFHFVTAPDPTGEQGLPGTQQFIFEDVPRELAKYGPQTAFFTTNGGMEEPLIKAVLNARQGYFVEQPSPCPTSGYPPALGLQVPPGKSGDMEWITAENKRVIAAHGMSGHFGAWAKSFDITAIHAVTELLIAAAEHRADPRDSATVSRYFAAESGPGFRMRRYSPATNQWLFVMDHVVY